MKILLTNIGRRTYLLDYLCDLKKKYKRIKIFVSDSNINAAGMNWGKNIITIKTPQAKDTKKYLSKIKKTCIQYKIDLVIPISDRDLSILSLHEQSFKKIKTKLLISSNKVIKICNNKLLTHNFCKKNNINTPEIKTDNVDYSFILKPIYGSGSKNIIYKREIYKKTKINNKKFFYQKKISGQEYGLDILNDFEGRYVSCCIKKKLLIRSGETDQAEIIFNNELVNLAKKISKNLKHIGNLDCDVIKSKNKKIFVIDLNPRFGGGYPFTHKYGYNYLKFMLEDAFNLKKTTIFVKNSKRIFSKGISLSI